MTGSPAPVGDNRTRSLHDRFPIWVRHVGDQDIPRSHLVEIFHRGNHANRARPDAAANTAAFAEYRPRPVQPVAFQNLFLDPALDSLWACLQDEKLTGLTVKPPLNVHRLAIVCFNGDRHSGQSFYLVIAQGEGVSFLVRGIYGFDRGGIPGFRIDHLDQFAAEMSSSDGRVTAFQRGFVNVELIGIDRSLHDTLPQSDAGRNEDCIRKSGFSIQGKGDAARPDIASDHALDARGDGNLGMIKTLVHTIRNRPVIEK